MRNHIHLVLETTDKGGRLSEIMKGINLSYVQYYKNKHRHICHFWQGRYINFPPFMLVNPSVNELPKG